MRKFFYLILFFLAINVLAVAQSKRKMRPSDVYRLQTLSDAQASPDGGWIAYVLSSVDSVKDKRNSDIWMVSWDGQSNVQLTNSADGEYSPRWSPDGKYISFLSSRQAKKTQVWIMDRRGGEAKKITDLKHDMSDYKWSPDSRKLLLTIQDAPDTSKTKTVKPYVLDRYQFKQDIEGYLLKRYTHLYLFDIETKKLDTLTRGNYTEESAAWSPDGTQIAFVSNRTADPDKNENSDIWIVDAKKGASLKQLTTWNGYDNNPRWSPDGRQIAYTRSSSSENFIMYDQAVVAVVPKDGGEPRLLTKSVDRPVNNPVWSKDGQAILALVADDRQRYVGEINVTSGKLVKMAGGSRSFQSLEKNSNGSYFSLMSEPFLPAEIYAIENG